ncbi:unnamed protein product [Staurois parvus]|uniref:Uncharacterized protein n=1 Tax=Staurois parvus TaxID=386267 RepID=A0ABN9AR12_9NEOB|nr:unnamed protein product [Staurois parvus]
MASLSPPAHRTLRKNLEVFFLAAALLPKKHLTLERALSHGCSDVKAIISLSLCLHSCSH